MSAVSPRVLRFEPYRVDLQGGALLRGDEPIPLRPKSFDVLRYLAEHAGRLVGKDELIQAVWPGNSVTDDSLVQCIRDIRQALGDEARRIVRTVPRRGYLFATDIAESADEPPPLSGAARGQDITSCRTSDGVNIAIGCAGRGLPVVRTSTWFNHLEYEWRNPLRAPLLHFLADRYRLIRYDGRGNGLSDRDVSDVSFEASLRDLEAAVDALGLDRYALFGTSQGVPIAIAHAARHPDRVSKLVLHGGYARGRRRRESPREDGIAEAFLGLIQHGWGDEHSPFMRMFSMRYMPHGSAEQIKWLSELQHQATSGEHAARVLSAGFETDVVDLLPKVTAPTLVLHCRHDVSAPFDEGRRLAASIPNAKFVVLESENHLPIPGEAVYPIFLAEIEAFLSR